MDDNTYSIIRARATDTEQRAILRPIEGWALDALGNVLDRACPGILLHSFTASTKWRQSVFLALASGVLSDPDRFLLLATGSNSGQGAWTAVQRDLAECMISMSPRQIVEATLGEIPDGLLGCFNKLGPQPMQAADYTRLVEVLVSDDPTMKLRAKTLLQLNRLNGDLLAAVLEVDEIALSPTIVGLVRDKIAARRLNQRIAAIRAVCSGANDEALRQSLHDPSIRSHDFAQAWISKADRPPPVHQGLDLHADFERITPATAGAIGREFSNCLRHKTGQLVSGIWGAWVWRPGGLIATVTACQEGPLLTGVYAHGNQEPDAEHVRLLKAALRDLGVICFTRIAVPQGLEILTTGEFGRFVVDDEFE